MATSESCRMAVASCLPSKSPPKSVLRSVLPGKGILGNDVWPSQLDMFTKPPQMGTWSLTSFKSSARDFSCSVVENHWQAILRWRLTKLHRRFQYAPLSFEEGLLLSSGRGQIPRRRLKWWSWELCCKEGGSKWWSNGNHGHRPCFWEVC